MSWAVRVEAGKYVSQQDQNNLYYTSRDIILPLRLFDSRDKALRVRDEWKRFRWPNARVVEVELDSEGDICVGRRRIKAWHEV